MYRVNKEKSDDSLPLLAFWRHVVNVIFRPYSKEEKFSSSQLGIRNIPSDIWHNPIRYDDTKHYQVQSEHRCIQIPLKHLKGSVNWIHKSTLSYMFEGVLNTPLLNAGVRCTKRTLDAIAWNVNLRDMRFDISMILVNVWPRNLRFKNLWISSV